VNKMIDLPGKVV